MTSRLGEGAIVAGGLAYLVALSWAIENVSYDVWGALIVVPVYAVLGAALVRRMFNGPLEAIATAMYWGLLIKLGGAFARYWVGFEAYGGGIDAAAYHRYANEQAGAVWSGDQSVFEVLPHGTGTEFLENFTAFAYTLTGASQLAGFVTFSMLAYAGTAFFVKAAIIAVPSLAARRYAWMCVLFPSIVYWPSSIGKEAIMMLGLGIGTYGIARMLTHGRWFSSLLIIGCGLGFSGLVRPHIAGIWIAAALPGLVVALIARSRATKGARRVSKTGLVIALVVAAAGFAFVSSATVKFLAPSSDDEVSTTDSLTQIFEETARRTSQAGSNFTPPSVSSPMSWPYASIRTLTRPLPIEARGIAQLVSAGEMALLLGIYIMSSKRLMNLPRLFVSNPYVTFVVTALFLTGLAYSSLANLGILTRQKSLIIPLLVLIACVPIHSPGERKRNDQTAEGQTGESRSDVLAPKPGLGHAERGNAAQIRKWTPA